MSLLKKKKVACYVLSQAGLTLALKLADFSHIYVFEDLDNMQDIIFSSFANLPKLIAQTFTSYDAHIFFCAAGISVRSIAPHITHKKQDPAVIVCDEQGQFAISLLSGHWGDGNALTIEIADILRAKPVITTATDVNNKPSVDILAKENSCTILDWDKIKICNSTILKGKIVQLYDPINLWSNVPKECFNQVSLENDSNIERLNLNYPAVAIHWRKLPEHNNILRMTIPALHLGIGCKKGTDKDIILNAIADCLKSNNLEEKALACIASVDIKQDENGLLQAAQELGIPFEFYSAETLAEMPSLTPSGMAAQLFGLETISICEGAAICSANGAGRTVRGQLPYSLHADNANLILPKMKYFSQVTLAIAVPDCFIPSLS